MNYTYVVKFEGNILVVGRTGCGKTTFVQNLVKNQIFGDIKEVLWISKISLSTERENNIRDCFVNQHVDFQYPNDIDEFEDLLDICQRKNSHCKENVLRENILLDRLIVMDNVSGLADRSETFSSFLAVSRKLRLTCVYVFHTIYPGRQNWQMIISQTKIFNIFPGSVQASTIMECCLLFVQDTDTTTCQREIFGQTDFFLAFPIQVLNSALQLTLGTLTT